MLSLAIVLFFKEGRSAEWDLLWLLVMEFVAIWKCFLSSHPPGSKRFCRCELSNEDYLDSTVIWRQRLQQLIRQHLHQDSWYIRIWNVSIPYKLVLLVRVHFKVAEMLQKSYYICNFLFFLIRVLWIWLFDILHATGFPPTWKTWKKSGILKYFSRVGKTLEFGQNH